MNIYLCYGYLPDTTAVYYERALQRDHEVLYVGPPSGARAGFASNVDLTELKSAGFPEADLVLFIEPGLRFFPRGLDKIDCPTAAYLIDVHRHLGFRLAYAPFFDYIFVAQRDYVREFQRRGYHQTFWLPLACDPGIHVTERQRPRWDIAFIGALNSPDRARRLALLGEHFVVSDYRRYYPKEAIADVYSQARIVFNSSIGGDLNMRVFEAMASGAMLLTDRVANGQEELFQDGVHLVEYGDDDELLELARYYLVHDDERERIAHRGAELVRSQHTYLLRAQLVLDTVFAEGEPQMAARIRQGGEKASRTAYASLYAQFGFMDAILEELERAWRQRQGCHKILVLTMVAFAKSLYWIFRRPRTKRP
jgi:hypothetical protein